MKFKTKGYWFEWIRDYEEDRTTDYLTVLLNGEWRLAEKIFGKEIYQQVKK